MAPAPAAPAAVSRGQKIQARAKAMNAARGDNVIEFGPPTKADNEHFRREARARDKVTQDAYDQGKAESGHSARKPAAASKSQTSTRKPRQAKPTNLLKAKPVVAGGTGLEEGAGVLLGLVLFAMFINYVHYGPAGVKGWFSAKFLNKPYGPAVASAPAPASTSPPVTYPSPSTLPPAGYAGRVT